MTHGYSTGHTVTALDTLDTRLNVHNTKVKFKATLHVSFIGFFLQAHGLDFDTHNYIDNYTKIQQKNTRKHNSVTGDDL